MLPGMGLNSSPFKPFETKHKAIFLQQNGQMPISSFPCTEIEYRHEQFSKGSGVPTILREGPYRIYWYSHEPGEPPHVHVDKDQRSAKFWLDSVRLARNIGFPAHELRHICSIIEDNQLILLEAWNGYFGT